MTGPTRWEEDVPHNSQKTPPATSYYHLDGDTEELHLGDGIEKLVRNPAVQVLLNREAIIAGYRTPGDGEDRNRVANDFNNVGVRSSVGASSGGGPCQNLFKIRG